MVSLSIGHRAHRLPPYVSLFLLGVLTIIWTALMPSSLSAQTKERQQDQHQKLGEQDLAQLKEIFKDNIVSVTFSAGDQKSLRGKIVGVRTILGERFLQLDASGRGSIVLINCKFIVSIY
jgi:hypothetical protein